MRKRSRNTGPWLAFGEGWFRDHQWALLWLLNSPLRRVFRRVMAIPECDCPLATPILAIGPNRFTVAAGASRLQTTFRTHPKYAKRVYFALRPLWWALHAWDSLLPMQFAWARDWSFGFDTLTVYPDPHPEVTSVDGTTWRSTVSEQWGTLCTSAGNNARDDETYDYIALTMTGNTEDHFQALSRGIFLFDTSSLGENSEISSATLSLRGTDKGNGLGSDYLHIISSNPTSPTALVASDHQTFGSTSFGSVAYASYSITGYNDIALNASGRANVNKTGVSKFGTRLGWDLSGTFGGQWQSYSFTQFIAYMADYSGTSADPKLVVVYSISLIELNRSDTAALAVAETQQSSVSSTRTDAASVGLAEAQQPLLASARADAAAIALAEASQVDVLLQQLDRADAAAVAVCEVSDLLISEIVELARADAAALAVTEQAAVEQFDPLRELAAIDAAGVAVSEVRRLQNAITRSDGAAVAVGESINLLKFSLPAPSTIRVGSWLRPAS